MAPEDTGASRKPIGGPAVSAGDSSIPARPISPVSGDPPTPGSYDATLVPGHDLQSPGPLSGNSRQLAALGGVVLEMGTVVGSRYEITKLLGMGGMGAVYEARDRELDRAIGLKIIRPDLAGNPEILARFKRELILARQVTHRNIIRIFDLNEADGLKFITMEFIQGEDLRTIFLRERKLAPEVAVDIILQVCYGLATAHKEGVIHRDLKPSNIMRDTSGRVVVMDFGLARTMASDGMTQTGLMIGTMEYMSPEQALGVELDARSDLFALGLIFYEALSGDIPFKADSAIASLVKRTTESARPLREFDGSIPEGLSDIVAKCLARDPAQRYASAPEIIADLKAWRANTPLTYAAAATAQTIAAPIPAIAPPPSTPAQPAVQTPPSSSRLPWKWISLGAIAIALAYGATLVGRNATSLPFSPAGTQSSAHKTVTVLLADFRNSTSESVFKDTLEPAYALGLEGASFISVFDRAQARGTLSEVKPGATELDEANARLVALRQGINFVVSGYIAKEGSGYKLVSKVVDVTTGKTVSTQEAAASDKSSVLRSVATLASQVRKFLGDPASDAAKAAEAETFTSDSLEAAHEYAEAQASRYAGKTEEAIRGFRRAIELDSNFGSAYGNLAALYWNNGNQAEAKDYYKRAMQHIDRMTDREKYRTRGGYYLAVSDGDKAVEEFNNLVKQYPADSMGLSALAHAYYLRHDMTHAVEASQKAIAIYPKNVVYRTNASLYALFAGDYVTAEREANAVLAISPNYTDAMTILALCATANGKFEDATAYWIKIGGTGNDGASAAAGGLADLALYRSDPEAAMRALDRGIQIDLSGKNNDGAAKKLVILAEAQLMLGRKTQALASVKRALSLSKQNVLFAAARVSLLAGDNSSAAELAAELDKSLDAEPQAFGKLIEGDIQLAKGKPRDAIRFYEESARLMDSWLVHFDLARAYAEAGAFPEASTEVETCLRRKGEATDIYIDEQQTFRYFPPTYFYMGKALEGLNSPGAPQAYRNFLSMKIKDAQDPMVAEAQKGLSTP